MNQSASLFLVPSPVACTWLLSLAVVAAPAAADQPSALYSFPAGGQRGQRVDVKIGACFLHGEGNFEMLGPGVQAPKTIKETETLWMEGPLIDFPTSSRPEDYPRDHAAQVQLSGDAPLGPRLWRVWTSEGITSARKFFVGNLPEVVEQEITGRPVPTEVTLPVTINGRTFPREDVDLWSFPAQEGQTISCAVRSHALGSPLLARIEVRGPQGRPIAEAVAGVRPDPRLQFTAPADGQYQVAIHDVNFGGLQDYVYRLTITAGPFVQHVYPLGGRRGEQVAFELCGAGLPQKSVAVKLPAEPGDAYWHAFTFDKQASPPVPLALNDLPEQLEQEPNNEPAGALQAQVGSILNGRIERAGDVDHWALPLNKDRRVALEIFAARLGSRLDSVLEVVDADGKVLGSNDDLTGGQPDAKLEFRAPAEATYYVRVADRFSHRGGRDFAYRLKVTGAGGGPDFRLRIVGDARRSINADAVTVVRDLPGEDEEGKKKGRRRRPYTQPQLQVAVERQGGFQGEVELAVVGLPEGVSASGTKIAANRPSTNITFRAAPETKIGVGRIGVTGLARIGDRHVAHAAQQEVPFGEPRFDDIRLAVAMPAPFALVDQFMTEYASRGGVYRRSFRIDRGGFEGPLQVRLADRQTRHLQGVTGPTITVPPEADRFTYPITLPPWMQLARTSRSMVMLVGEVTDHDGSRHTVSYSSSQQGHQMIVIVSPGLLSLQIPQPAVMLDAGGNAVVPFRLHRDPQIAGEQVEVKLALPPHVQGVAAEPVTLSGDQQQGALKLTFDKAAEIPNLPLTIRAATLDPESPQVDQSPLELVSPLAAK